MRSEIIGAHTALIPFAGPRSRKCALRVTLLSLSFTIVLYLRIFVCPGPPVDLAVRVLGFIAHTATGVWPSFIGTSPLISADIAWVTHSTQAKPRAQLDDAILPCASYAYSSAAMPSQELTYRIGHAGCTAERTGVYVRASRHWNGRLQPDYGPNRPTIRT
jgi:hypothetical protein